MSNLDPFWYGSIHNNLQYKGWQLDVFLEMRKQRAYGYLYSVYRGDIPGTMLRNTSDLLLNRWQLHPDQAKVQKLTTGANDEIKSAINNFLDSDGAIDNAFFAGCGILNYPGGYRLIG